MNRLFQGLAIITSAHLVGEIIRRGLGIPIPGNVIGFALVALALFCGWIKVEALEEAASLLLQNLTLLFTPVIVGTIIYLDLIRAQWIPMLVTVIPGTLIILILTGKMAQYLLREGER